MEKFVFRIRPFSFLFVKNWYSFSRWKNPITYQNGDKARLIDIGCITFGFRYKEDK